MKVDVSVDWGAKDGVSVKFGVVVGWGLGKSVGTEIGRSISGELGSDVGGVVYRYFGDGVDIDVDKEVGSGDGE